MASRPDLWGERGFGAKLTEEDVALIRLRRSTPELRKLWSYSRLAKEFGVSRTHANKIAHGLVWKHTFQPFDLEDKDEL